MISNTEVELQAGSNTQFIKTEGKDIEGEVQNKVEKLEPTTNYTPQKYTNGQKYQQNGVDITFENVNYVVPKKVRNESTNKDEIVDWTVLNGLSGICKQGEVTAIMGASGAGKTSLLNIICKRISSGKGITLNGQIQANGVEYQYAQFSDFASYIMQDDRLLEELSVKEVLQFGANLKVKGTQQDKDNRVKEVIRELRLNDCQDVLVGGKHLKGISGGQRKRTSIAFEMVKDPQVLFLDEPTSGLDSFTAFLVINLLKKLAREQNKTVIFTIHQPSSDIWEMFDRVMLLVKGKFIYQGPGDRAVINHFNKLGFPCPSHSNPADYLMSIMHREDPKNVANYPRYYEGYSKELEGTVTQDLQTRSNSQVQKMETIASFSQELAEVYKRTFKIMKRNPILLKARFGQTIFMALFVGIIYWQIEDGKDDPDNLRDLQNYTGFFFFQSVNQMMMAMMPTILTFPDERGVFLKEENGKFYKTSSYYFGRTILEFPFLLLFPALQSIIQTYMVGMQNDGDTILLYILGNVCISLVGSSLGLLIGSAFSDPKVASSMMPMFIMPFMLFAGFFQNRDDLWVGISWIEYLSPFKYGFDAHINNEFKDTFFRPSPVDTMNLTFGYWESIGVLMAMFFIYRVISFIFLYSFKQKLQ